MGIFSNNRSSLGMYDDSNIIANENYFGEAGAYQIIAENHMNDQIIFESLISNDFLEATLNEAFEIESLHEASTGNLFTKIKEFVKKAWEKIKGLFKNFIAKITILMTRDNKSLVNKYKKTVVSKDLSKMKCKISKEKSGQLKEVSTRIGNVEKDILGIMNLCSNSTTLGDSELNKLRDKVSDSEYMDSLLSKFVSSTTSSDFSKDLHEKVWEDLDEHEGFNGLINDYMNILINSNSTLKEVKDMESNTNKLFKNVLSQIEKMQKEILKGLPKDDKSKIDKSYTLNSDGKDSKDKVSYGGAYAGNTYGNVNKSLNLMQTAISKMQQATTMAVSGVMKETKFRIAQARKVFGKAVTFNPKAVKESALLSEAMGETLVFEMESFMESYEL